MIAHPAASGHRPVVDPHPADHRPVVVGTDPDRAGTAALRWAADEAARRGAAMFVLPLHAAADLDPAGAALLVVDATAPGAEHLVVTTRCPVVAVPPGGTPVAGHPVVLGLGPATAPEVIDFAVGEAELHGVALQVVRTWDDPAVDLGRPLPVAIARWDEADERCRRDVTARLTGPRKAHRDVDADVLVVHESGTGVLPAFGLGAPLMVVGQPGGGAGTSTALAVLHALRCPLAVVPSDPRPAHSPWRTP